MRTMYFVLYKRKETTWLVHPTITDDLHIARGLVSSMLSIVDVEYAIVVSST